MVLVFNSASHCGFTPQLAEFRELHQQYAHQGLSIIGFPCNQFKQQEPDSHQQIAAFCEKNYGVPFLISEKIDVNGSDAHPLWQELKRAQPGILGSQRIKWNFTKFLINRQGQVIKRAAPYTKPIQLTNAIEAALHR